MLRHIGLDKNSRFLGIDSRGKIDAGKIKRLLPQNLRILWQRDGVEIYYAVKALVLVLQGDPILEGAEIIADMKLSGRLRAAENTFLHKN